jgi:hypothetical protein
MTRFRQSARLLLPLLIAVSSLGAVKCGGESPVAPTSATAKTAKTATKPSASDSADQIMFGVRGVLTHGSVARGILLADTAYVSNDGTRYELRDLTVTFYDSVGAKISELLARGASYDLRAARLEPRGEVTVVGTDGRRLQTGRVVYDIARDLLVGDTSFVFVETAPARQRAGNSFETDPQLLRFRVAPRARGTTPSRPAQPAGARRP